MKIAVSAAWLAGSLVAQPGWVAESEHFRIVAGPQVGIELDEISAAAARLESIRARLGAAGLSPRRSSDEPQNILLVPSVERLRTLSGGTAGPRTRGLTIKGVDRNLILLVWGAPGDPNLALAHEYAHQLEDSSWPLWFVEGRAEFLARYPSGNAPNHLTRLLLSEWLSPAEFLRSDEAADPATHESFYAAAWLTFDWLVEREGDVVGVRPEDLEEAVEELGLERLDATLWEHAERRRAESPRGERPVEASPFDVNVRAADFWEVRLFEAEIGYAIRDWQRAASLLSALARDNPDQPRIHAARGLLAIATKDYDQAEVDLARAVELGDERAVTAYRYALMLMRPGGQADERVSAAVEASLHARDRVPEEPRYQLTVGQALMLAGEWDQAFEELNRLAEFPGWAERAAREADEVRRRRSQILTSRERPRLAAESPSTLTKPTRIPEPRPLPDPPAEKKPVAKSSWPPPGTTLAYGRIAWVDCSGGERKIILHTPHLRLVLREDADNPARLIFPPVKWKRLPCETYGWTVNIAYKRLRGQGEISGQAVAIRF